MQENGDDLALVVIEERCEGGSMVIEERLEMGSRDEEDRDK